MMLNKYFQKSIISIIRHMKENNTSFYLLFMWSISSYLLSQFVILILNLAYSQFNHMKLILERTICIHVLILTTVCFISPQLAVPYSVTFNSIVGAGVGLGERHFFISTCVVIIVESVCCCRPGAIMNCFWGRVGGDGSK